MWDRQLLLGKVSTDMVAHHVKNTVLRCLHLSRHRREIGRSACNKPGLGLEQRFYAQSVFDTTETIRVKIDTTMLHIIRIQCGPSKVVQPDDHRGGRKASNENLMMRGRDRSSPMKLNRVALSGCQSSGRHNLNPTSSHNLCPPLGSSTHPPRNRGHEKYRSGPVGSSSSG